MAKKKLIKQNPIFFIFSLVFILILSYIIVFNTTNTSNKFSSNSLATFKQKNKVSNKFIVNGLPTKRGDWPFIVGLFDIENYKLRSRYHRGTIADQENIPDGLDMSTYNKCSGNLSNCPSNIYYRFFCAGSLISNEWILTAEHCVYNIKKNKKNLGIAIGMYDLKHDNIDQKNRYIAEVQSENITLHDDICYVDEYGIPYCVNDIALIRINNPLNIGKTISLSNIDNYFDNKKSLLLGWGYNTTINIQKINEKDHVFTSTPYKLLRSEQFFPTKLNLDNKLNRYYKDEIYIEINNIATPSCTGDSGGPMISYDENAKKYYLTGIISSGGNATEYDSNNPLKAKQTCISPSFTTNISKYSKWIMDKTKIKTGFLKKESTVKFDNGTFTGNPLDN